MRKTAEKVGYIMAFRNSFRLLTTGIAFLVIGVILTVMAAGTLIDSAAAPADFNSLNAQDVKAGMIVEGDLEYNFGSYVELTMKKDNAPETTSGYYYLIGVGEESIMGLYAPVGTLSRQLDKQSSAFWDILNGESDVMPEKVHFKGKIKNMDDEDVDLFKQSLEKDWGYTGEEIEQYGVLLYVDAKEIKPQTVLLVIGIVVSLLGLLFGFLFIRQKMMGR